jgi:hypothetical protein
MKPVVTKANVTFLGPDWHSLASLVELFLEISYFFFSLCVYERRRKTVSPVKLFWKQVFGKKKQLRAAHETVTRCQTGGACVSPFHVSIRVTACMDSIRAFLFKRSAPFFNLRPHRTPRENGAAVSPSPPRSPLITCAGGR